MSTVETKALQQILTRYLTTHRDGKGKIPQSARTVLKKIRE